MIDHIALGHMNDYTVIINDKQYIFPIKPHTYVTSKEYCSFLLKSIANVVSHDQIYLAIKETIIYLHSNSYWNKTKIDWYLSCIPKDIDQSIISKLQSLELLF